MDLYVGRVGRVWRGMEMMPACFASPLPLFIPQHLTLNIHIHNHHYHRIGAVWPSWWRRCGRRRRTWPGGRRCVGEKEMCVCVCVHA